MSKRVDYIVVGAGSAGCIVANRLTAQPDTSVVLLEAGPSDKSYRVQMPAAFAYAISSEQFDWNFVSETQARMNARKFPYPRGKVLGGSSSINAMAYTRGNPHDFERWAGNGLPQWSYAHCLPYFRRAETFSGGGDDYRGGDGPLHVTAPTFSNPLYEVFLEACTQADFPRSPDTNGKQHEGVGPLDQSIHAGLRMSTAKAYLDPVKQRNNLTVLTHCNAQRLLFDGHQAVGVEYLRHGQRETLHCEKEVIVCTGALKTPQLLMLSGVGDAAQLKQHGIKCLVDLPSVGQHMQDHLDIQLQYECRKPVTVTPALKLHHKALIGLQWVLWKSGKGATNHFEAGGNLRTREDLRHPDVAAWFMPLLVNYDGSPIGVEHGYQLTFMLLQPKTRGLVGLYSANPFDPPRIEPNFLSEPEDLATLRDSVKVGRRIMTQAAFDPYRAGELLPGPKVISDSDIEFYVRDTAKSTRHPSCTCRMGIDEETSVVDGAGRVHRVQGLRIIDASVMPSIASAALNAPTIMVAEKLADAVLGQPPLDPMIAAAAEALAL